MARITLYVADDLKARMDAAGNDVNWSDVARPAFMVALTAFEHRKSRNVSTAIERLRASKLQADQNDKQWGNRDGRAWAENIARYGWLKQLHLRRKNHTAENPEQALKRAIDPDDEFPNPEEFAELIFLPEGKVEDGEYIFDVRRTLDSESAEYWLAFVEGAVEFFLEVREEVERSRSDEIPF